MRKLLFILACVIVPQSVFGAVIYQQSGAGTVYSTATMWLGTGNTDIPSIPISGITTIRFSLASGNIPTSIYMAYTGGTQFSFFTPSSIVSIGGGLYDMDFTSSFSGSPIVMSGLRFFTASGNFALNGSNLGVGTVFENAGGSSNSLGSGSVMFALCSAGNCGSALIPTDGITSTPTPTAQTYANNPVPFSGVYNNGVSQAYDTIQFDLINTTQSFESFFSIPTQPISQTGLTYSTTKNLPLEGNYTYNVRLWNTGLATSTAWFAGTGFALATTTATSTPLLNAPALVCDTLDVACYVKKAFIWLLYPTDALVSSYDGFLTTIQEKPPIGYFTLLTAQLTTLNASSTPIVNFIIPASLKTYIFTPFDIAIASILWFYFAIHFYKRLKTITI